MLLSENDLHTRLSLAVIGFHFQMGIFTHILSLFHLLDISGSSKQWINTAIV